MDQLKFDWPEQDDEAFMKHQWIVDEKLDGVCKVCGTVWNGENKNRDCDEVVEAALMWLVRPAEPNDAVLNTFVGPADGE